MNDYKDWEKAGRIAAESLEYGKHLIKKDASLIEVTEKIEEKIFNLGGKPAFPVQISLNDIAAHYNAFVNDQTIFNNEVIKIDVGVSYNGAIGDNALTIDLNGDYNELVKASREALNEILKNIRIGIELGEIGKIIEEKIQEFNFSPVRNLSGHGLGKFTVHTSPTIPNYNNEDKNILKEGQVIAIEPFATNGEGFIYESKRSEIYSVINSKPLRDFNVRKILEFINKEYGGMPFAKRWLVKKFPLQKVTYALFLLEKENIIKEYMHLSEKSRGLVSQAEHSVIILDKPKVITKVD